MTEEHQIVHMLVRVPRLAAQRWCMFLTQAMSILGPYDALGYIRRNFGLFHMEGDEAVLDDVEEYLAAKGVAIYASE